MKKLILSILIILCCFGLAYALEKNVASQNWAVFCFDETDGTQKTGDASQISGMVYIDGAANVLDDVSPDELSHGMYLFGITAAESNGNYIVLDVSSSTANIQCQGAPTATWTDPANWNDTTFGYLDASVSSRAPSSTALSTAVWTAAKAGFIDASVSSRSTLVAADNIGINWADIDNTDSLVVLSKTTIATTTTNADMRGTDSAFLAASAPTNISVFEINASGQVDVYQIENSSAKNAINNEILDVLTVDIFTNPGQGAWDNSPTIEMMNSYLYFTGKNRKDTIGTFFKVYDNTGTTVNWKSSREESSPGGVLTYIQGEMETGP